MSNNRRSWICSILVIGLWSGGFLNTRELSAEEPAQIAIGLQGQKKVSKTAREDKLSPELRALLQAGETLERAKLVGRTPQGKAVVQAEKAKANRLFNNRDDLGVDVSSDTEDFVPIHRLIVSYEKGKRPTDESLLKAGLKVIEDYEKGTFLIVEPTNAEGITIDTVTQLDKHKLVKRAYPSYSVKLTPPKPKANKEAVEPEEPLRKRDPAKRIEERPRTTSFIRKTQSAADEPQPKIPSDKLFRDLWGMTAINAPLAWSSVTASPVIVAVIDTGIDYKHPDLIENVWTSPRGTHGFNALSGREDPMDDNGHGTHCAGTIAARGNNSIGVAGVCWNVQIMGLKFLDARGRGNDYDAIKCIDYAIDHGAKVLNNSWGGYEFVPEMHEAIERAKDAGALFIAAAGNDGNNNNGREPHFPSSYENENVIAVMSIDPDGSPSDFTNYGFDSVDLAAPGRDIWSTWPGRRLKAISGTSMATPHVSGAAALLWGHPRFKTANWQVIRDELLSSKNIQKEGRLADLCVTGGILDIEFLAGELPETPPEPTNPTEPTNPPPATDPVKGLLVAAASNKFQDAKSLTGSDNLMSVRLTLTESCEVWIRAETSVRCDSDLSSVSTGFLNDKDPEKRWQGSARRVSLSAKRWTSLSSAYVVNLEPGTHELFWKVWDEDDSGQKLTFNAGTMTVLALRASGD